LGEGFIITVRHGEAPLHDVRLHTEHRPELLECGPGAALYAIVDWIVDHYLPVVSELDRHVEEIEREVFSPAPTTNTAERIYELKRQVLGLHAAVVPLAEPLDLLARGRHEVIAENLRAYFRDVHDHLLRVIDRIENCRDLLTSVLAANMTQVTVRQNEDMRKISAWGAIIVVPALITGIYGMNFQHMPELSWRFGYPLAIAAIVLICFALYRYFRRIGWLSIAFRDVRNYLRSLHPQLPRDVWILQVGGLTNAFGNGIVLPFLIIYLHNVRGIPLGVAGLVAAFNSVCGFLSGFAAGTLSDSIGPRRVLIGALCVMSG